MAETGRPTIFTQELADVICELLAMGWSMRKVVEQGEEETGVQMPAIRTIFKWLRENESFMHQYARAKEEAVEAEMELANDIAEDGRNDWMEIQDKNGTVVGWRVNGEAVQRSKLRVDLIKWKASKLKPRKYGEKLDLTSGGKKIKQSPIIVSDIRSRSANTEQEATTSS